MSGNATNTPLELVGVDLSLTSTGICVGGRAVSIASKAKGVERLIEISTKVVDIASASPFRVAIVEGYSFGSKFTRAHAIGELGGAVKVALHYSGFSIVEVPPSCRAKFASGRGNAPKSEVIAAVGEISGIEFSGAGADDRCDAWVLEQMGLASLGESKYPWSQQQLSSLEKVDWDPLYKALGRA
jgi:Holliday junction resolvasome RuvABC endonuclease subunit